MNITKSAAMRIKLRFGWWKFISCFLRQVYLSDGFGNPDQVWNDALLESKTIFGVHAAQGKRGGGGDWGFSYEMQFSYSKESRAAEKKWGPNICLLFKQVTLLYLIQVNFKLDFFLKYAYFTTWGCYIGCCSKRNTLTLNFPPTFVRIQKIRNLRTDFKNTLWVQSFY